ncbi:hypothetical protein EVAR_52800_1 [Eumeta japonica]|uniref:Uncharacterized protein n=1 Tax=Eumeta variegata TaxID=151549 RepID=A0A4C1Y7A7_EUMVA|nr:hypothetical protein EVAR_52800_1 [Eumeta japonica]
MPTAKNTNYASGSRLLFIRLTAVRRTYNHRLRACAGAQKLKPFAPCLSHHPKAFSPDIVTTTVATIDSSSQVTSPPRKYWENDAPFSMEPTDVAHFLPRYQTAPLPTRRLIVLCNATKSPQKSDNGRGRRARRHGKKKCKHIRGITTPVGRTG